MKLREHASGMFASAREIKEGLVEEWWAQRHDTHDLRAYMEFFRDDKMICMVQPMLAQDHDADERTMILFTLALGISGLKAEAFRCALDTFRATTSINPMTGKEWERGEMAKVRYLEEVREAITIYVGKRTDDGCQLGLAGHEYDISNEGELIWSSEEKVSRFEDEGDPRIEGAEIVDFVRKTFNVNPFSDAIEASRREGDPWGQQAFIERLGVDVTSQQLADVLVFAELIEAGCGVLFNTANYPKELIDALLEEEHINSKSLNEIMKDGFPD